MSRAVDLNLSAFPDCRVEVAAGILLDSEHRVLIAERLDGDPFNGMWEFPGGKINTGESPESALVRELAEEIGIVAQQFESFMKLDHDYPDRAVRLHFFMVSRWSGDVLGMEGQVIRWVLPKDIEADLMLPADSPVIAALCSQDARLSKWR